MSMTSKLLPQIQEELKTALVDIKAQQQENKTLLKTTKAQLTTTQKTYEKEIAKHLATLKKQDETIQALIKVDQEIKNVTSDLIMFYDIHCPSAKSTKSVDAPSGISEGGQEVKKLLNYKTLSNSLTNLEKTKQKLFVSLTQGSK